MATLAARVTALAAAVRDKLNTITPRLIPPGGAIGHVITKTGAGDYAAGWQAAAGGGGGSGAAGSGEIDFGVWPGASTASLVITGQAAIVAGSVVEAWLVCKATADHSADEVRVDPPRVAAGAIVPGTGFTIFATARERAGADRWMAKFPKPYGRWAVAWRWQ